MGAPGVSVRRPGWANRPGLGDRGGRGGPRGAGQGSASEPALPWLPGPGCSDRCSLG
ncbi:Idnk [Phodopus roborovskii]|uniref:Idnk protein n=1 Tax=Phodopus roborovskii TaxID=109678 RepID=A0AAV0A8Q5_PHORO|nr:Idnk [Phodopus roborovskii]